MIGTLSWFVMIVLKTNLKPIPEGCSEMKTDTINSELLSEGKMSRNQSETPKTLIQIIEDAIV